MDENESGSRDYPLTDRNRVRRRRDRGHYDRQTVHAILDAAMLCHISYVVDGQPYCTPTSFWREGDSVYWHGSSASRMLRSQAQGIDVCLAVTHVDSLVLARSAFGHSINYRSAMLYGRASLIEDDQHKLQAINSFIDRFYPGRSGVIRAPTRQELNATSIVWMPIEQASAKIRDIPPHEEKTEDYARPVWAGVIPLTTVVGAAVNCERLAEGIEAGSDVAAYRAGTPLERVLGATHSITFNG